MLVTTKKDASAWVSWYHGSRGGHHAPNNVLGGGGDSVLVTTLTEPGAQVGWYPWNARC